MRTIDANALKDHLQSLAYDDWNQGVSTSWADAYRKCADMVDEQPTIQPDPSEDVVNKNVIIKTLNEMDRYVSEELRLCGTDKKFPKNEVFIVDDVYEEIVENLPYREVRG